MTYILLVVSLFVVAMTVSAEGREIQSIRSAVQPYGFRVVLDLDDAANTFDVALSSDGKVVTVTVMDASIIAPRIVTADQVIGEINISRTGTSIVIRIRSLVRIDHFDVNSLLPDEQAGHRLYVDSFIKPAAKPVAAQVISKPVPLAKSLTSPAADIPRSLPTSAASSSAANTPPTPISPVIALPSTRPEDALSLPPDAPLGTTDDFHPIIQSSPQPPSMALGSPLQAVPPLTNIAPPPLKQLPSTTMLNVLRLEDAISTFPDQLRVSPVKAHEKLADALMAYGGYVLPTSILTAIDRGKLPGDYIPFFTDYLPAYTELSNVTASNEQKNSGGYSRQEVTISKSDSVLVDLSHGIPYTAEILFLPTPRALKSSDLFRRSDFRNAIAMTGTYTSPQRYPTGLFISAGRVVNPALQRWDGIVSIDAQGQISVGDLSQISINGRRLNLRNNFADFRDFLTDARRTGRTVIQSHLLVRDGASMVTAKASRTPFRRRIVFSRDDGSVGVYDSGDRALSLFDAAQEVARLGSVRFAVNLDMGAFDFCQLQRSWSGYKCGTIDDTTILSNILIIHYEH
ncbi:hypothetical protein [Rhodospirillum sp. A1_3_36]|uniref:hypothetical protein n=1 Tax=Rhodospirillum sp. A1_3_36 TaxID=3391666 RepID=UPI0039A60620